MLRLSLILLCLVFAVTLEYDFKCPDSGEWRLRAVGFNCSISNQYVCLFKYPERTYHETCDGLDYSSIGSKLIYEPYFNKAHCSYERYQPFPFSTDGDSKCVYQKSFCTEKGQYLFQRGSQRSDITCGCDLTKGYEFVTKQKHDCYCVPSEDDCSCHKLPCNNLVDQCPQDGDELLTRSMFTTFQEKRFKDAIHIFDGENNGKTYRFLCLYISSVLLAVMIFVVILVFTFAGFEDPQGIPVDQSDDYITKTILFTFADCEHPQVTFADCEHPQGIQILDGTEIRRYVRIQVIGKDGVGKSSLVRRLVGDSNMKMNSTDGIDIVKKCQIRTTNGEWIVGKVEADRQKIIQRMQQILYKKQEQSESLIPSEEESNHETLSGMERKHENDPPTILFDKSLTSENKVNIRNTITSVKEQSKIDKTMKGNVVLSSNDKFEDSIRKIKNQDIITSESLVDCGLWDFSGHKDYYATHQTFFVPHAIYIIVTNISEDIAAAEDTTDFDSIAEYIDFWFDSIHCLRTSSPGSGLYPPVIVVCTHIDEYKTEKEVEDREKKYIAEFNDFYGNQDKALHLRGIVFISNTEFLEKNMKLRHKISEVAKEMNFFAENLPTQYIKLENALNVMKECKQNVLSWQNIMKLAKIIFTEKNELLPFLNYQHKIGNIIFFADIKEYIILQPDWLVKCFRCLVCDNHPLKRNIDLLQSNDWHNLETTGQLSDNIIDRLFEKEPDLEFRKYKTHILNVMEKFDIIVKPKIIATNNDSSMLQNSYYMPCMIKTQSTCLDIIQKSFGSEISSFSFSPWLILEFKFLPLIYFNHILFYYITRYTVCKEKYGQTTLYRGKALVNLDKTGIRKLCICFSKNVIALQIWRLAAVEFSRYDTILEELCRKIEELKRKLSQNISYDIKAKCRNGDYSNKQGRISYKELGERCEQGRYLCPEHNEMHSKDDVEKTWLQHAELVMAKFNKRLDKRIRTENEPNKERFDQVQAPAITNLPDSVTLRQQFNIKESGNQNMFISSCANIGNTLVFTDSLNIQLIICNSDGTDIHHIPLSYIPDNITVAGINTVAVSCDDRTILVLNISTRSVTTTINTSDNSYGISYNDNNLYVVGKEIIHVMDLTGKVIRTIPLPTARVLDITVDLDRLVCRDRKSIYCCSLHGQLIWTFTKDEVKDLGCVTNDDEGNVYVTNVMTHTVGVVFSNGDHYRELFTKSDGLNKPRGIYFDKQNHSLLVCNEDGQVVLFDVKKKATQI